VQPSSLGIACISDGRFLSHRSLDGPWRKLGSPPSQRACTVHADRLKGRPARRCVGGVAQRATAAQRAVLEPPYHLRLDRPAPATTEHGDGAEVVTPMQRADFKIEHDSKVFGTKYF
jgi:hypothetical protein